MRPTRLMIHALAAVFCSWSAVAIAQTTAPAPVLEAPATTVPPAAEGQLSKTPDKPEIPSFQKGSGTRAGGPANELNTGDRRAAERLPGGNAAAAVAGSDLYHGNYCGRGNRGPGVPPTDELDAACMRHDACYDQAGRPSCRCDAELRREALAVANGTAFSRELRARAASVVEAAQVMQCQAP